MAEDKRHVRWWRTGRAARVALRRPQALNALTRDMVDDLFLGLEQVRDDPAIDLVVLEADADRAFCAGGDIRGVRDWVLAGDDARIDAFFTAEYTLNRTIARFPKPYVSLIDGLCMGGGVGLSMHGSVRVVTERASIAMPEVGIGFFPDVGASFLLPRLRRGFGLYLGLTGHRVDAADAYWLGLATHFVPRAALPALAEGLGADGLGALADHARLPPASKLARIAAEVADVFGRDDLPSVFSALAASTQDWAQDALAAMRAASPAALEWTFALLRAGAGRSLEAALRAEFRQGQIATRHPDFAEGVRAMVVDKDRTPRWQPVEAGR